ncbi:hypothetical protein ACHAWF_009934 [Thalassiosira exigua]
MAAIAGVIVAAYSLWLLRSCNAFRPAAQSYPSRYRSMPSLISEMASNANEGVPEVYPLSRKKVMLIEEAKRLNAPRGSYSPIGWSNRHGSVLTPASIPGVYTADRPFYWNKIDVGCRMTVVRLETSAGDDGSSPELLVHSPVALDPPLVEAVDKLGRVAHVISPNYEHVKYAHQWAERYPEAKVWGCPGLAEREPNVRWTGEVPRGARPPGFAKGGRGRDGGDVGDFGVDGDMWDWEEVQPLHVDTEVNPFTGRPFFNEVVFYHAPSKTLLVTDLYWNYPRGDGVTNGQVADDLAAKGITVGDDGNGDDGDGDFGAWELAPDVSNIPLGSRFWGKVGMDKLFYPFYMNFMVKNDRREEFEKIAKFITCGCGDADSFGWEVETIIPAHGDIVRGRELCRKVLETHFNIRCPV